MRPQARFQAQPVNRVDQALPRFITKTRFSLRCRWRNVLRRGRVSTWFRFTIPSRFTAGSGVSFHRRQRRGHPPGRILG
jgi:hypothetical protein